MVKMPSFWIFNICTSIPSSSYWTHRWPNMKVIIKLVNIICGVPTILIFTIGNPKLLFKFLTVENLHDSWPTFVANPIITPLLTASTLSVTTISNHVAVITTSSDWITPIPTGCFQVSTTITFYTLNEVVFIQGRWCSIMWLPIGILFGAECGCEYTFSSLLLSWINERMCQLCGPNSMPLNLFWTTRILGSYSCGWSITVFTTFYDSTCPAIFTLMCKSKKGQSIVICPSQNA